MSRAAPRSRSAGFSIVELMVAMAISLVLFAGAVTIYLTSKTTYTDTDRYSRLQDTGRIALDFVTREGRAANLVMCTRRPYTNTALTAPPPKVQFVNKLESTDDVKSMMADYRRAVVAYDGTGGAWGAGGNAPAFDGALLPFHNVVPGSDVLVVRAPARDGQLLRFRQGFTTVANPLAPYEIVPPAPGTEPRVGDVMVATDCDFAGVFRVTNFAANQITHTGGGNIDDPANPFFGFSSVTTLAPLRTAVYFVAPSRNVPPGAAPFPNPGFLSLYRRVSNPEAGQPPVEELVEGVESLQVQAMVSDTADGRTTRVLNPRDVARWEDVTGLQIALLVRTPTEEGTLADSRTYQLLDAAALGPFNDRRQRLVFNTTVTVRNWVP